jgi:iron complex transport system permease protein
MSRSYRHDAPAGGAGRRVVVLGVLVGVLVVLCGASLVVGSALLAPDVVWHALRDGGGGDAATIVRGVRVPRTVLGVVAGLALGAAGAVMQGHTRNPLADPGLFGVTAGASLAVVLAIFVLGVRDPAGQVWFAVAGSALATGAVLAVAARSRSAADPVPLALAGVAVSALLTTATSFVVLSDRPTLDTYRRWVVGSLAGRGLDVTGRVAPFVVVGLVLAVVNSRALDLLGLGPDVARGLGQRVLAGRLTGLAAVTLLTAAATAAAGPIAFLGLIVPLVARRLVGTGYRWVVPCSSLLGAALLLSADIAGRLVPGELQAGVTVALLGAPAFVAVARTRRTVAL